MEECLGPLQQYGIGIGRGADLTAGVQPLPNQRIIGTQLAAFLQYPDLGFPDRAHRPSAGIHGERLIHVTERQIVLAAAAVNVRRGVEGEKARIAVVDSRKRFEHRAHDDEGVLEMSGIDLVVDQADACACTNRFVLRMREKGVEGGQRVLIFAAVTQLPGVEVFNPVTLYLRQAAGLRIQFVQQGEELPVVGVLDGIGLLQELVGILRRHGATRAGK